MIRLLALTPFVCFGVIGVVLALNNVAPNATFGVRTGRTLSDAELWARVNSQVGWALLIGAVLGAGASWYLFAQDLPLAVKALGATAILMMVAVLAVLVTSLSGG